MDVKARNHQKSEKLRLVILLAGVLALLGLTLASGCSRPGTDFEKAAAARLKEAGSGRLLTVGALNGKLDSLKSSVRTETEEPGVHQALLGSSETELLAQMEKSQIRLIALPWPAEKEKDKTGSLYETFWHGAESRLFSVVYVDPKAILLAPVPPPYRLTDAGLTQIRDFVRAQIKGGGNVSEPAGFGDKLPFPAWVDLRATDAEGFVRTVGVVRGEGRSLKDALTDAAGQFKTRFEKGKGSSSETVSSFADRVLLTINLYLEPAPLNIPLKDRDLDAHVVLGFDGLLIDLPAKPKSPVVITPDKSKIYRSDRVTKLLEAGMKNAKAEAEDWKKEGVKMRVFREIAFTERAPAGEVIRLHRGSEYVPPAWITRDEAMNGFKSGAEWLVNSFDPSEKMFRYTLFATRGVYEEKKYNIIRHGLATLTMIQAYELTKEDRYLTTARLAIEWVMSLFEWEGEMVYFRHAKYDPEYKVGGAGVLLQAMCEYVRFEPKPEWEKGMKGLAEFIMRNQKENGQYRSYYTKPGEKTNDKEVTIYPGENNLALVRAYLLFKDDRYLKTLDRAFTYYSGWFRDKKNPRSKGDLGPYVPWDMSAMLEYWEITKRDDVALYAYEMADWILDNWYVYGENETYYKDFVGGYHNGSGKEDMPLWNSGVYGEGVASVAQLARLRGDRDRFAKYRLASLLTIRFVRQIQFRPGSSYHLPSLSKAIGCVPSTHHQDDCRLDYAYHCLTVNYRALRFFDDADWNALPKDGAPPRPAAVAPLPLPERPPAAVADAPLDPNVKVSPAPEFGEVTLQLSAEDKDYLTRLARRAFDAWVKEKKRYKPDDAPEHLKGMKSNPVFTSIYKGEEWRGCVSASGDDILEATVAAVINTCQDKRFKNPEPSEVDEIRVEVWVLQPKERIESNDDGTVQKALSSSHGLFVKNGSKSAYFLPYVFAQKQRSMSEWLSRLSKKAGLSEDAWKDSGTKIYRFLTLAFGEESPRGKTVDLKPKPKSE